MRDFLAKRLWRAAAALTLVAALATTPPVLADDYNNGAYGTGTYNSAAKPSAASPSSSSSTAPDQPEPTVVQTESGLQVAINLSNGQLIPSTGYYITITPLNGQGESFDKAEIYLDGQLAHSGAPDSTGTLRWLWDTAKQRAAKVKIIVFGPGAGTTTHEFDVTVAPVESATTVQAIDNAKPISAPSTGNGWQLWVLVALGGSLLLLAVLVWVVIRRRRRNQLPPPPTAFTPLQ